MATPIAVNFKQETTGINLYLSRPGSISGHVYEANGVTPLASANVFAFPVNPQLTGSGANSQPDNGSYKIQGLVTGDYVVQVTVTGHVSKSTQVKGVTAPNETQNINFSLKTYPYMVKIVGQGIVSTQGGSVNVSDTSSPLLNAGVDVPAGALSANTVIDIGEVDAPAFPSDLVGIGSPVHFGPEGLQFTQPVTVKIPYKQEDLDKVGGNPNNFNVYTFNTTALRWEPVIGPKTVDTANRLIMIAVNHFSIFQLGIPVVCATDATNQVIVTRGGFRYNRGTGQFVQVVTLQNTGATALQGPVSLVLDNLSSNATLANSNGNTACATPSGSPYINLNALNPNESATVTLKFTNSNNQGIRYTTRVLAGSSNR